jgi:hypothetical protein
MTTVRRVSWALWLTSFIILTLLFVFEFSYGIPLLKFIQSDATRSALSFNRYSINLFLSGVLRSPLGFTAILPFISLLSWLAFLQLYRSNPVQDMFKNVVLCLVSSGILLWIMTEFAIYMAVMVPFLLSKGTP